MALRCFQGAHATTTAMETFHNEKKIGNYYVVYLGFRGRMEKKMEISITGCRV